MNKKCINILPLTKTEDVKTRQVDDIGTRGSAVANGVSMEERAALRHVDFFAFNDYLTGLPNRRQFFNKLTKAVEKSSASSRWAIMLFNLDRFKIVNDSLGYHLGDDVLRIVGERIQQCIPEDGRLARIGGDEFAIHLPELESHDARRIASTILTALDTPIKIQGHEFRITTSIGIAYHPDHGTDSNTLMQKADIAMNVAKIHRNAYKIYSSELQPKHNDKLLMESHLRHALLHEELSLHYQPRIKLDSHQVTSAEALIRWNHPTLGLLFPSQFIPVAEETGMIVSVGKWVLETVAKQIKSWLASGIKPVPIAVNVSPVQFHEEDIVETVRSVFERLDVDLNWLEIEVTETAVINNPDDVIIKLKSLQQLGIQIAMDDFGIGYSSLDRLRRLPINTLKIDQSFIRDMTSANGAITSAIITLGHDLNLTVVAEGVETEQQLVSLQRYGCDEMQGYLYSRPVCSHEFQKRFLSRIVT